MADTYIDPIEIGSYGPFAVRQIETLVLNLDPAYTDVLVNVSGRLTGATQKVARLVGQVAGAPHATYQPAAGETDVVEHARDVLTRLITYVTSRPDGQRLRERLIGRQAPSTATRRRVAKLLGLLGHALTVLDEEKALLPEYTQRREELAAARTALDALDTRVRKAREGRREMTPDVQAAREEWLTIYGALKLLVESVLRLHDRLHLMPEVFDDLAEVHRAPGVSDGDSPPKPPVSKA